jgi:hypothetical protein
MNTPKKPKTCYQVKLMATAQVKLFCLLVFVLGYPQGISYIIAFRSNATIKSANVLACNLINNPETQRVIERIMWYQDLGLLVMRNYRVARSHPYNN